MFDIINDPNFLPITIIFVILVLVAIWQKLDKFIYPLSVVYVIYLIFMIISLPSKSEEILTVPIEKTPEKANIEILKLEKKIDEPEVNETIIEVVEKEETVKNEEPPDLRVNSLLMCEAMIDTLRKPINIRDSFPISMKRVYCYSGIRNALSRRTILYEWYFQNKFIDSIPIEIGRSVHWRSWTYKTISDSQIGDWHVIIRDQITDTPLDTSFFSITDE